jgi:photosystem II stability/assembly factor-like uncharacterized protein
MGGDGGDVITQTNVLSVAISSASPDVIFAGTEPSALYRSDDGGDTWREVATFQEIPSKSSWSFPPKPETHHVRWITLHPTDPGRLFAAVEAGALVQSGDGGDTWQDRVDGGPYDSHTVLIHPDRPDRLLSAAGDGYFESDDLGQTWRKREIGLPWRYCYGLAVDSGNPDLVLMSVSPGAHRGHGRRANAQAAIVRRRGDGDWEILSSGLPEPEGTTLSVLAADPSTTGRFFALNNSGVYRTEDEGTTWQCLDVPWKDEYLDRRPPAIAISPM